MSSEKEKDEDEILKGALDELEQLADDGGLIVTGRIYRITSAEDAVGRPTSELVGKVDGFIDEDFVGRKYGSGKYKVRYLLKTSGDKKGEERNLIYNIGREYDKYKTEKKENTEIKSNSSDNGFLNKVLDNFTADKMAALGVAIKTLKDLFAPPPPPDYTPIFQLLLSQRNSAPSSVSDAIVIKAMEAMNEKKREPDFIEQFEKFTKIKDLLKGELKEEERENDNEDGDGMNLIKTAFEYLPMLLQKNNNNFKAVGQEAAGNPLIKNLIANDEELAAVFFEKAKDKYGLENARNLAAGFGYNITEKQGD